MIILFFNGAVSSADVDESGGMWYETVMHCFQVLTQHLPEGTEKTTQLSLKLGATRPGLEPGTPESAPVTLCLCSPVWYISWNH